MQILIISFSPTGNTLYISKRIKNTLKRDFPSSNVILKDITIKKNRMNFEFSNFDFIFFGFPVYAWKLPQVINKWIRELKGLNKNASSFFTYGGINSGIVHLNSKKLLEEQDFNIISSAEFVASHSFNLLGWDLLPNRPNEQDLLKVDDYVSLTLEKHIKGNKREFDLPNINIPNSTIEKISSNFKKVIETPSRMGEKCSLCLKCEEECPVGSMNAKLGKSNSDICLRCLRCVKICPEKILKLKDKRKYQDIVLKLEKLSKDEIEKRKSKIFI